MDFLLRGHIQGISGAPGQGFLHNPWGTANRGDENYSRTQIDEDQEPVSIEYFVHPNIPTANKIFIDVLKRIKRLRRTPTERDFLIAMHGFYTAVPLARGS